MLLSVSKDLARNLGMVGVLNYLLSKMNISRKVEYKTKFKKYKNIFRKG